MPKSPQQAETLRRLASQIQRWGMQAPVAFALELFSPFDFLSSQLALFVRPFTAGLSGRWGLCVDALSEEANWHTLRQLLAPAAPEQQTASTEGAVTMPAASDASDENDNTTDTVPREV